MKVDNNQINALLQTEDIEGLLEIGAPKDEYTYEAEQIALTLKGLRDSEFNQKNISDVITKIWMQSFDLGESEINLRMPGIKQVAKLIANSAEIDR